MPYRALVALTVLTLTICAVAILLPPGASHELNPTRGRAEWQAKGWAETRCDRCRKNLTANPQDGLYLIGGQPYMLHQQCVAPVAQAARR